jgi:hypothetical protein
MSSDGGTKMLVQPCQPEGASRRKTRLCAISWSSFDHGMELCWGMHQPGGFIINLVSNMF